MDPWKWKTDQSRLAVMSAQVRVSLAMVRLAEALGTTLRQEADAFRAEAEREYADLRRALDDPMLADEAHRDARAALAAALDRLRDALDTQRAP